MLERFQDIRMENKLLTRICRDQEKEINTNRLMAKRDKRILKELHDKNAKIHEEIERMLNEKKFETPSKNANIFRKQLDELFDLNFSDLGKYEPHKESDLDYM